jgi:predicted nucleic acid-binding protein
MTAAPGKVVFDTNILISAHFWKGPPYRCLLAAEARLVVLVLSDPMVSELREKLTAKFDLSAVEVEAILNQLSAHAERVHVQGRSGWVPQDPQARLCARGALRGPTRPGSKPRDAYDGASAFVLALQGHTPHRRSPLTGGVRR